MEWIGKLMDHLRERGQGAVEPTAESEEAWAAEVAGLANATLFPRTDSWWTGANIEGKPRYFSVYLGGSIYYMRLADVEAKGYPGLSFEPAHREDDAQAS
jgi:cyclohexanone monooxygenase